MKMGHNIAIDDSSPKYDCAFNEQEHYLVFRLPCSKISQKTSVTDMITMLNSIDMNEFETVYKILCPEEKYVEPMIQAIPYIY